MLSDAVLMIFLSQSGLAAGPVTGFCFCSSLLSSIPIESVLPLILPGSKNSFSDNLSRYTPSFLEISAILLSLLQEKRRMIAAISAIGLKCFIILDFEYIVD